MKTPSTSQGELGKKIADQLGNITLAKVADDGLRNAEANQPFIKQGKSIAALIGSPLCNGESALVIGAGPSLHRFETAKIIKESNYRGTIVATESSMAWCLRNGIIPHFVVTLDPHAERIVRWFGDSSLTQEKIDQDDYFSRQDMDPAFRKNQLKFNQELVELINQHGHNIHIAISSSASEAVVRRAIEARMHIYWWNPMYDDYEQDGSLTQKIHKMNGLPCVNAGGNVGTACWVFAQALLAKKHVALAGIDFGYYADTPYLNTQYYYQIRDLLGEDRLEEAFVWFDNPHNAQKYYTDPAYLWYRNIFMEMVSQSECTTYNCTGGGILFGDGITWMDLEKFLAKFPK